MPRKWTKEALVAAAAPYETRGDFAKGNKPAYSAAWKLGLLDELGLPYSKWTEEAIREEIKKYSTYSEFRHGSRLAFTAMENKGWYHLAEHLPRYVHKSRSLRGKRTSGQLE